MNTWIARDPQWFLSECESITRKYRTFRADEAMLHRGILVFYGELIVRPPGGTKRQAIKLIFPEATPHVFPIVVPIERMPEFDKNGCATSPVNTVYFDRLHQMPGGGLCLFQQETRASIGGESIRAVDVLKRAEQWLIGHFTGHWPLDSHQSELESHFFYGGDVLLGERLFDLDLTGSGEFYAVQDIDCHLINNTHDRPPFLITSVLDSSKGVAEVQDARKGLIAIFPWLDNDFWKPANLSELIKKHETETYWRGAISCGYWWTIPREPSPFRDGEGLLRELETVAPSRDAWKMVSDALKSTIAAETRALIGLKYPSRDGGASWLIVHLEMDSTADAGGGIVLSSNDNAKRDRFTKGRVSCLRSHAVRPTDIQLRNTTVVSDKISERTVVLVGLGALGSRVAELLAQAGVGKFRLCDPDRLSIGNVARHVGGLNQFGSPKVNVVASRIQSINSYAVIDKVLPNFSHHRPEQFAVLCKDADIVISTIADESAEAVLNQVAMASGITMIYGRAMRRGSMGRVFLVRPGKDACKCCLSKIANDPATAERAAWIDITETENDAVLHECGRPVIPASAVDLSFVAALIGRKAMDVLEGTATDENHLVWCRDGAADVDERLSHPFSVVQVAFDQLPECPVCQQPPINTIDLPVAIRDEIAAMVEGCPTVETGGVLIGYIDGRTAIVTRATGPGPNAKQTPTRLERDVEFVQLQCDLGHSELGARGCYIGEWHSHLVADPSPSGQDIQSMAGIAVAPNYATTCPVMMIAGLDTKEARCANLKAWSFPITGQAHQIQVRLQSEIPIRNENAPRTSTESERLPNGKSGRNSKKKISNPRIRRVTRRRSNDES